MATYINLYILYEYTIYQYIMKGGISVLIHVVRAGESLWSIANQYYTNPEAINGLNQLPDPNHLLIGQSLLIPSPYTTHRVKQGESLWSIAKEYGITVQAILQINRLSNPISLVPGQGLLIPPLIHVVQPGESLKSIAIYYDTTIQDIILENHILHPDLLQNGMSLIIPHPKPEVEVNAYSYQNSKDAIKTLSSIGHLLTYFSPFAYMLQEDGSLQPLDDQAMIDKAIAQKIIPMMSITNFSSTHAGSNLSHVILSSPELRNRTISNIIQAMKQKGYTALNVDFENVLAEDGEHYIEFLKLAVERLHPYGYVVSIALAPKISQQQSGLLYAAHDYEAFGAIVDFVILMTYEWGYRKGPPQAISPINQMKKVIDYALPLIPLKKIFLGFQIYARDWLLPHVQGQEAETFSPQEAIRRATQYGVEIRYDATAQSPFFNYIDEQGRKHEVWFEDARSAQAKFDLMKEYHLPGVSYWVLGYSFPQNWALLENNFNVKKLIP